jgi:branched-chain amino acid transport system substrate-binding protein
MKSDITKRREETMNKISRSVLGTAIAAIALSVLAVPAMAQKKYDPGASDTEIKLGQTAPYSGPVSAYGIIGQAAAAYFKMVNEQGGINGRKVTLITDDDGFSPPKTVELTRRMVEQDQVLAIYSPIGTAPNSSIQKYLNDRKVPHLLVPSGASRFANAKEFPWTLPWLPTYITEGAIYARHIVKTHPGAKVAVLYQNDDSGKDYLEGFKSGFGAEAGKYIVATASHEITDPTIDSQLISLKASGANVLAIMTSPKFAAMGIRKTDEMAWKPERYLATVSNSVAGTLKNAGMEVSKGIVSASYIKDPTDPQWKDSADFKAWLAWKNKYLPDGNPADSNIVFSYVVASVMTQILKQAGNDLTRANVLAQATNLKDLAVPMLLPGIKINTSKDDYLPIQQMSLMKFDGEKWVLFGDLISQ